MRKNFLNIILFAYPAKELKLMGCFCRLVTGDCRLATFLHRFFENILRHPVLLQQQIMIFKCRH